MPFLNIADFQPIEPVPGCRMRTPFGEHLMLSYLEMDDGPKCRCTRIRTNKGACSCAARCS